MLVAVFLSAVPAGVLSANKRQKLAFCDELQNKTPTLKHVSTPPSSGKNNGNQGTSMYNQELIEKLRARRKSVDAEEGEDEEEEKEEESINGSDSEYDDAFT